MKFVYVFTVSGQLAWSGDNEKALRNRTDIVEDLQAIDDLVEAPVGSFIKLITGEMVFKTEE